MSDNRQRQLTLLGWLLHVAAVTPLLIAVVVYLLVAYQPRSSASRHAQTRIDTLERLLSKSHQVRKEHADLNVMLTSYKRRSAQVRTSIPDDPQEAQYLRQLTEAAGHEGVTVDDYTRGNVIPQEDVSQLEIRLKCLGTYKQLCGFLHRLENVPRASKVTNMTWTSNAEDDRHRLHLTILLFFGVRRSAVTGEEANS